MFPICSYSRRITFRGHESGFEERTGVREMAVEFWNAGRDGEKIAANAISKIKILRFAENRPQILNPQFLRGRGRANRLAATDKE